MRGSPELEVSGECVGRCVGGHVCEIVSEMDFFFNTMRTIPENEINLKKKKSV